jgi:hypothetical protein
MTTRERTRRARQRRHSHARVIEERKQRRAASLDQALGWRIDEWVALTGTSRPTVWRQNRDGKLKIIYMGGIPLIPRVEAVRLGFINA